MNDSPVSFQPCQIVCLEQGDSRLYAEVVQLAPQRGICWVRPLMIVDAVETMNEDLLQLHDLRQGADLLLPAPLFRAALDEEVIPLLTQLYASDQTVSRQRPIAQLDQQQVNRFVRSVCQARPDVF